MRELNLAECEDVSGGMTGDLVLQDLATGLIDYFSSPAPLGVLMAGVVGVSILVLLVIRAR